ncbi:MAG: hypothetical protein IJK62_06440 [Bacteroidales bacterium]|nr:hypothetical protein [Bacteroidales bacterium]
MKRLVLTTLISIVTFCAFAQSINLSFTGQTIRGRHVDMDSIAIRNLTQGWSVTLVAPDTACAFTLNGITLHSAGAIGLSQNVPNPFHGTTEVNLALPKPDKVTMQAFDMGGRVFANYNGNLPDGEHRFEISLASPQSYLLSANTSDGTSSIKMVNLGSGGTNSITYIGQVAGKTLRDGELEINYGDNLQFAGYTTYIGAVYESEATIVSINSDSDVEQPIVFNLKSGSFDEIIACDSYTWIDGVTYRESNHTATYTYTNSMDCDSVVHLNLTIGHSDNTVHEVTAEECAYYQMSNGEYFTENGDYHRTLQSSCGCDSIVLLHLTITCENGNEGTFYDERDSITYRIIEYNGLTWFAEDLRTTHFTDGTEAPRTSGDMYVYYKSEWGHWGDIANQNGYYDRDYGYYYNRRGYNFCPEGWRLPTQSEWQNLINTMRAYGDYGCGGNGDAIKSMVSTSNWNESDVECTAGYFQETNNSRGLGLNPDGVVTLLREHHGFIYGGNEVSAYLTSSSSIAILYNSTDIIYDSNPYDNDSYIYYNNIFGVHIRCVRDN